MIMRCPLRALAIGASLLTAPTLVQVTSANDDLLAVEVKQDVRQLLTEMTALRNQVSRLQEQMRAMRSEMTRLRSTVLSTRHTRPIQPVAGTASAGVRPGATKRVTGPRYVPPVQRNRFTPPEHRVPELPTRPTWHDPSHQTN